MQSISRAILILSALVNTALAADVDSSDDGIERPFLTRDLIVFGIRTPITPMTLIILAVSGYILFTNLTKPSTATASHILLDDSSDATKEKLIKLKKEIGNDKAKFAEYAAKHSTCPSGKSGGGSLGKFRMGAMVPPFDKVVFAAKSKVGEVLGPVQTQFGWHLILVHERDEQRSLVL